MTLATGVGGEGGGTEFKIGCRGPEGDQKKLRTPPVKVSARRPAVVCRKKSVKGGRKGRRRPGGKKKKPKEKRLDNHPKSARGAAGKDETESVKFARRKGRDGKRGKEKLNNKRL